jgi:adenylyltransferase/sulfurtransferase
MPEIGMEGQMLLKSASVLLVGAGGLGSPAALYLAAAGVGRLGIVEYDTVDESNLQRQILHTTEAVGASKLESACARLCALNPHIQLEPHPVRLSSENALEIVRRYDVVLDGTDNFATRYLLNDACILLQKPLVYGAVHRFEGQVSVFDARLESTQGACYRCLFPTPPPAELAPNCAEVGVLGVVPGIVGMLQATEALKILLRVEERRSGEGQRLGETLTGRMTLVDTLTMQFSELKLRKRKECQGRQGCSHVQGLIDYEEFCGQKESPARADESSIDLVMPSALASLLALQQQHPLLLVDVREAWEREVSFIAGSKHIPLAEFEQELAAHLHEFQRTESVVLYCTSGKRSAQALGIARKHGLLQTRHLAGGIAAWQAEHFPVQHSAEAHYQEKHHYQEEYDQS